MGKAKKGGRGPAPSRAGKKGAALPARSWIGEAGLVSAAAVGFVLVCGYTAFLSPVLAGVLAGVFIGLAVPSPVRAAILGGAAGLIGGLVSAVVFAETFVVDALNAMPAYANQDVITSLYTDSVLPLLRVNLVNSSGGLGAVLTVLIGVAAAGAAAYGVAAVGQRLVGGVAARKVVAWCAVAALVLAFLGTAAQYGAGIRTAISSEPPDGGYAYDGYIGLRAYYEMGKGLGYYDAVVRAAAGDARLIKDKAVVDGKFHGWAFSPSFIRLPYTFYLWRVVAPSNGGGIFVFSLLVCGGLLALSYWAFADPLGERALLVPMLLLPNLLLGTLWANVVMPEWWAALAGLAAILLAVRGKLTAAMVAALAASLFREVMAIELVLLGAVALWLYVRGRRPEHRNAAIASAAGLAVFALAYAAHYKAGAAYIATVASGATPLDMLKLSASRDLQARFLAPASYMMFPYGYFVLPAWVFLIVQVPGLLWVLRSRPAARLAGVVFAGFWLVFTLTIGGSSSYWGQFYMPFSVLVTAALLAGADEWIPAIGAAVRSRVSGAGGR